MVKGKTKDAPITYCLSSFLPFSVFSVVKCFLEIITGLKEDVQQEADQCRRRLYCLLPASSMCVKLNPCPLLKAGWDVHGQVCKNRRHAFQARNVPPCSRQDLLYRIAAFSWNPRRNRRTRRLNEGDRSCTPPLPGLAKGPG